MTTTLPRPAASGARLIEPVALPPAEGYYQYVHPDVVATPPGTFAFDWHLVLTPYPGSQAQFENPYVYASADGLSWLVEPGEANPVARPRAGPSAEALSDPALVSVPEIHELWLYYRSYTVDSDLVWLVRSGNAVNWSTPTVVLAAAAGSAISPSIVHRAPGDWLMWTVNGHCVSGPTRVELRRSADGIQWSDPETVTLPGLSPWHVFVRWVESLESWVMLTNVKGDAGGCLTKELYVAVSPDGVQWTPGTKPWLSAGEDSLGLFASVVYRSAFAEVGDSIRFWYSGAAMTYRTYSCWRGGMTCVDSVLVWSRLGTEIRPATDVLRRPTH